MTQSAVQAQALWIAGRDLAELRVEPLASPAVGELQVQALVSGISRGTESLVFHGKVPCTEWDRMRCPLQDGDFPFPLKYGYAMVGRVESGGPSAGRRVFALHPHQNRFNLPVEMAIPAPDSVSDERAVLAPQMETALNATWDAAPRIGDRIAVVGGGVIGILTAYLCARIPGAEVTLIDVNPDRRDVADALHLSFATPGDILPQGCDLVFHASGQGAGLDLALSLAGFEASVIELSWYGDAPAQVQLGGAFHSQRLAIRASQVGSVAPQRRGRWDHRRRLALALALCADPRLDALVEQGTFFADLPDRYGAILADPSTLCHLIRY